MSAGLTKDVRAALPNGYPDFMIIGAQKSGTTTLFDMLNRCHNFCGSSDKEPHFFTKDVLHKQGNEWYQKQFVHCRRDAIKFEATPAYLYYPHVPERIFSFNRSMKFIVVLREPSARCYSAWNMYRRFNESGADRIFKRYVEDGNPSEREAISNLIFAKHYPSFKKSVMDDIERYRSKSTDMEPSFVRRGIYFEQIENYLRHFSLKCFLFLEQRELNAPMVLLHKISDFLNIPIELHPADHPPPSNVGNYLGESTEIEDTLHVLRDFYRPHNETLFDKIGIRYDWNENA